MLIIMTNVKEFSDNVYVLTNDGYDESFHDGCEESTEQWAGSKVAGETREEWRSYQGLSNLKKKKKEKKKN